MSIDEQHVALPKLYGAPAYARPRPPVSPSTRPFDPDDMPIAAARTDDEQAFLDSLPARAFVPGGYRLEGADQNGSDRDKLDARPFTLRTIAGKLFGSGS